VEPEQLIAWHRNGGAMFALIDGDLLLDDSAAIAEHLNEIIVEPGMQYWREYKGA
jgi:hypothetical protein